MRTDRPHSINKQAVQHYCPERASRLLSTVLSRRSSWTCPRADVVHQHGKQSNIFFCQYFCFFPEILLRWEQQDHAVAEHADSVVGPDGPAVSVAESTLSHLRSVSFTDRLWRVITIRLTNPVRVEVRFVEFAYRKTCADCKVAWVPVHPCHCVEPPLGVPDQCPFQTPIAFRFFRIGNETQLLRRVSQPQVA